MPDNLSLPKLSAKEAALENRSVRFLLVRKYLQEKLSNACAAFSSVLVKSVESVCVTLFISYRNISDLKCLIKLLFQIFSFAELQFYSNRPTRRLQRKSFSLIFCNLTRLLYIRHYLTTSNANLRNSHKFCSS